MARGKPAGIIRVRAARHNSQRLSAKLVAEIKDQAHKQNIRVDLNQLAPGELSHAAEAASEWNSMLAQARAERGPQWDVGTQLFHVDKYSDLYYDSTLLIESAKKTLEEERADEQPTPQQLVPQPIPQQRDPQNAREYAMQQAAMNHHTMHDVPPPSHHRQHAPPPPNMNYPGAYPNASPMRGPPPPNNYPGGHFNGPPGQFYDQGHGGSPMRGMGMQGPNMGGMNYPPQMGGMQGMPGGGMAPPGIPPNMGGMNPGMNPGMGGMPPGMQRMPYEGAGYPMH